MSDELAPAAYEVDDFELIAVGEMGLVPAVAGKEVAIEFYGYAVSLEVEFGEEKGDCEVGAEFPVFAVEGEFHSATVACSGVGLGKPVQPFSLFGGFGHFQSAGLAYRT